MRIRYLMAAGLLASAGVRGRLLGRQDSLCGSCGQDKVCRSTTTDEVYCIPATLISTTTVTVTEFIYVRSTRTRTTIFVPRTSTSTVWSTVTAFTTSLPVAAESGPGSSTPTSTIDKGPILKARQGLVDDLFEAITVRTTVTETSFTGEPATTTVTLTAGNPITSVATTAATTTVWQMSSAAASQEDNDARPATSVATIAGAVVGVILALVFFGAIAWFRRKKSKNHVAEKKKLALDDTDSEMQLPRSSGCESRTFPASHMPISLHTNLQTTVATTSPPEVPHIPYSGSTTPRLSPPDPTYLHRKPHHQRNPSAALSLTHVNPRLSLTFPSDDPVSPLEERSVTSPRRRSSSSSHTQTKRVNIIPRKPVPTSPDGGIPGRAI